jgi:hypothetical protein
MDINERCYGYEPASSQLRELQQRITELEDDLVAAIKGATYIDGLVTRATTAEAQLEAVKPIAVYANNQADMAQIRLLKDDKPLYDDSYWQPVLDRIRFDLLQIKAIGEGE